ncbi:MAG: hypothetical protein SFX73_16205 [Kofleriaceae bacterium]|nr:hypothetical protein [Kofleriaceae bacterium]
MAKRPFTLAVLVWLAACGGTPQRTGSLPPQAIAAAPDAAPVVDPLEVAAPPKPLVDIDWATAALKNDTEANAVWAKIAPTGDDWERKLAEVPVAQSPPLAIALLHGGNFACPAPPTSPACPRELELPEPAPTATMTDPCLRRMLALWATSQLDDEDIPVVYDSLRAIAALPPPESQLVAAAIDAIAEDDHARRLELITIAHKAGNRDVAGSKVGRLDEAHLIEAATKHHIHAALEVLSAEAHRAVFLAAITDDAMDPHARASAISELLDAEPTLAADTKKALIAATKAKDCLVAAAAIHALATRGDTKYIPRRPTGRSPESLMRSLCLVANYDLVVGNDDAAALLQGFVPAKGLELEIVHLDPLSEVDTDGDGDPRTNRTVTLVPRPEVVFPEIEDVIRAFRTCTKTTCISHDREYRFHPKPSGGTLALARLEVIELPSCPTL